jgi:5-methylcytosine-specific restriction endonuclease McrA
MGIFKTIATITWKLESKDESLALEHAKTQLDQILNQRPQGQQFESFSVQVDVARMKDKKRLVHLGTFSLEEVFPYVTCHDTKRDYRARDEVYSVRMNSDRYHVFRSNPSCVACGLKGDRMILDLNPGDATPHFNLYAEENGRLVLMTKDHCQAKSKGGSDCLDNLRTMCSICNNIRGNADLSLEQILHLRRLFVDNPEKLPKKELRDLINVTRERYETSFCDPTNK